MESITSDLGIFGILLPPIYKAESITDFVTNKDQQIKPVSRFRLLSPAGFIAGKFSRNPLTWEVLPIVDFERVYLQFTGKGYLLSDRTGELSLNLALGCYSPELPSRHYHFVRTLYSPRTSQSYFFTWNTYPPRPNGGKRDSVDDFVGASQTS
ncbi:hypothetical protein HYV86_06170 [Candidatus Woesearchaeota archaeon]|nr:hypothetical protein [Candidatus Woesearchaeota archaeon]